MKKEIIELSINGGNIVSLKCGETELLNASSPAFRMRLRDKSGNPYVINADEASSVARNGNEYVFQGFGISVTVKLYFEYRDETVSVRADIINETELVAEWIMLMPLNLKPLCGDGGKEGTYLLLPYNEGALVDSSAKLSNFEPEYPSLGNYMMFPNMMFSQFASYLYKDENVDKYLTVAAYDESRGPKEITVRNGELYIKLYCGGDFKENVSINYPVVLTFGSGGWEASSECYRRWFEKHLPEGVEKTGLDSDLPDWYYDNTLIVSYPVRGVHDMDDMQPNALFPYKNALPVLDDIAEKTGMRLLVLLMHWEGTAPWAPPYVWPPYGGEETLAEFRDDLHKRRCMLGIYCSGFGFTEKSNLINEYDNTARIKEEKLLEAMCTGPDGRVLYSRICTGQRSGYDICPETEKGKRIVNEAYEPVFGFGFDYAQILDQNHGGAQYLCYSKEHGHPPVPGGHTTDNMSKFLSAWRKRSAGMLIGCESAAAEPFMGSLRFSDCRYELCYRLGRPVPLYAYLYHEYLRNFMGNQVSCPLPPTTDALVYRIAYSFACGDVPAIILTPDGKISPAWGTRNFNDMPDKDTVLSFLNSLCDARSKGLAPFLDHGKMTEPPVINCGKAPFGNDLPEVLISTWIYGDKKLLLIINPFSYEIKIGIDDKKITLAPREIRFNIE